MIEKRSWRYSAWAKKVKRKARYTCNKCGKSKRKDKVKIHAHHIKSWAKYPELRYDLDNGMALCANCHKRIHRKPFSWGLRK